MDSILRICYRIKMDIKCWGSRGSISVSGNEYLKYGGDTTCVEVTAKTGETVIVDAGTGIRKLGNVLSPSINKECHLFFTHAHWDHILGFPFFSPLLQKDKKINILNHEFSGQRVEKILAGLMMAPFFPITIQDFTAQVIFKSPESSVYTIGSLTIDSIPLSHSNGGVGYRFVEDGKSFVFLTDNELGYDHPGRATFREYVDFADQADILFHDAEFTHPEYQSRKGWGHSSISDVLDLAVKANVKKLGLFHINQNREDDQMDKMVVDSRRWLKENHSSIDCFAVPCLMALHL